MNQLAVSSQEFIKNYNPGDYEKPSVTTDCVIFSIKNKHNQNKRLGDEKELQVLLIKRKNHPFMSHWALPGGFVNMKESLLEGAKRELYEETGVRDVYLEQLYTWGDVDRDPRMRIISISYMALIKQEDQAVVANDDAEDAKWFTIKRERIHLESMNPMPHSTTHKLIEKTRYTLTAEDGEKIVYVVEKEIERLGATQNIKSNLATQGNYLPLAFDHFKILDYALERLASKIEYTPIAFNLLPDEFTLTELQKVYEVILNRELLAPNFRRKIAPMVIEAGFFEKGVQRRPAKLYCYKLNWNSWE